MEEPRIERLRRLIEEQYRDRPTGCGNSFGEILCYEIHTAGLTFVWLAEKWGVSLPTLGDLIADHCRQLEADPVVSHTPEARARASGAADAPAPAPAPAEGEWYKPKDAQMMWLLKFEDADQDDMIFTDEQVARAAWEKFNTAWNCWLFAPMPRAADAPAPAGGEDKARARFEAAFPGRSWERAHAFWHEYFRSNDGLGDGKRICEALGFDPTNHHNALVCPYCNPQRLVLAHAPSPPPAWEPSADLLNQLARIAQRLGAYGTEEEIEDAMRAALKAAMGDGT